MKNFQFYNPSNITKLPNEISSKLTHKCDSKDENKFCGKQNYRRILVPIDSHLPEYFQAVLRVTTVFRVHSLKNCMNNIQV